MYLLLRSLLVPAYLLSKYLSLKEEMSKLVGYSVVGLAAVLLGVLIVVPFVKGFFVSQADGYVDYPASLLTYAGANAEWLKIYLSTPMPKLLSMQSEVQNLVAVTPEQQANKPNLLGLITLAINALNGDANSNMIAKKIVGTIPPSAAAPSVASPFGAVQVAPVAAGQVAPVAAGQVAAVAAGQVAPIAAGQVVPSLSVNVAKQSATLDLLKSACQSLLSDTAAPLTGIEAPPMMKMTAPVAAPPMMNMTAPVAAPPMMKMTAPVAAPPAMAMPSAVAAPPTMSSMPPDVAARKAKR